MCIHFATLHCACNHTSIKVIQCDDAGSPFSALFCDKYTVEKHPSYTSLCGGNYCKGDPDNAGLDSADAELSKLSVELEDIDQSVKLRHHHFKVSSARLLQGGPLQQAREFKICAQLQSEMRSLGSERNELETKINETKERLGRARRVNTCFESRLLGAQNDLANVGSQASNQPQTHHFNSSAPLPSSLDMDLTQQQQKLHPTGHDINIHRHQASNNRSSSSSHSISRSSQIPGRFVVHFNPKTSFDAAAFQPFDSHQTPTPLSGPDRLRKTLNISPTGRFETLRSPLIRDSGRRGRGRGRGGSRLRATRSRKPAVREQSSSPVRRSGRLSGKQKMSYAEASSDEEAELSPWKRDGASLEPEKPERKRRNMGGGSDTEDRDREASDEPDAEDDEDFNGSFVSAEPKQVQRGSNHSNAGARSTPQQPPESRSRQNWIHGITPSPALQREQRNPSLSTGLREREGLRSLFSQSEVYSPARYNPGGSIFSPMPSNPNSMPRARHYASQTGNQPPLQSTLHNSGPQETDGQSYHVNYDAALFTPIHAPLAPPQPVALLPRANVASSYQPPNSMHPPSNSTQQQQQQQQQYRQQYRQQYHRQLQQQQFLQQYRQPPGPGLNNATSSAPPPLPPPGPEQLQERRDSIDDRGFGPWFIGSDK